MTKEERDRINRAEEIQRYTENRCESLERENAELRKELQKWKDEWQEQVQKATVEGYARTLQTIQLTKAKEIIRALLNNFAYPIGREDWTVEDKEIVDKAEQFLSEVEK